MQLEDFFDYKNKLMEDLLTNERIVELVGEDVSLEDAKQLAYTQVFPCEYVPETAGVGKTFVCFDVDIQKSESKTFYAPYMYIWVFAHRSRLRLPEGGVRTDAICSEIAKAIDGSRYYGLGQMELYSVKRFAPMTDFNGKVMTFRMSEVKRFYDPSNPHPTNRKTG